MFDYRRCRDATRYARNVNYRLLNSSGRTGKLGPKGSSDELISAVVEFKRRNPSYGCLRISQQINLAFGISIDKDVVRRILAVYRLRKSGGDGQQWLTFLGHSKDSLWSVYLFRCESILPKSHWVPTSHPFIQRLIDTIRRKYLDQPPLVHADRFGNDFTREATFDPNRLP